jgi:hypothetical protein
MAESREMKRIHWTDLALADFVEEREPDDIEGCGYHVESQPWAPNGYESMLFIERQETLFTQGLARVPSDSRSFTLSHAINLLEPA